MKDLSEIRKEIDRIDRQITALYEERMQIVSDVAEFKIQNGKEVLDPAREASKLSDIQKLAHSEFNRQGVRELFEHIMSMSRKKQYQILTEYGRSFDTGFAAAEEVLTDQSEAETAVWNMDAGRARSFLGETARIRICDDLNEMLDYVRFSPGSYGFLEVGTEEFFGNAVGYYNQIAEHDLYIIREYRNDGDETHRCLLLSASKCAEADAGRVSLCFEAPDECGTLYHLLSHLTYNDLNMNRIGSVVINTDPLDYRFFVDLSGNLRDAGICNALRGLSQEARNFRILGNYGSYGRKKEDR